MHVFHYGFFAMGTRFELVLPGIDPVEGQSLAESVESLVLKLEARLSRFDDASNVSEFNRRAFHEAILLDEELWEVFSLCLEYHKKTSGAFDIAILPLIRLWKMTLEDEKFLAPSSEKITSVLKGCGMHHIELDSDQRTLRFLHPSVEIDLGGFGKGFAVRQALRYLQNENIKEAFVSFGESSVSVIGSHPTGNAWPVGIEHFFARGCSVHTFDLVDASLSTSGNAPVGSSRSVQETPHGHVINPITGRPIEGCRLLSVVSDSPLESEILSTALLVTPMTERDALLTGWFKGNAVEIEFSIKNEEKFEHIWKFGNEI